MHRVLRPSRRRGTRSGFPAPPIRAVTRTPAWTPAEPFEVADARPSDDPVTGRTADDGGARAQRVGLAAAERRHADQSPAARRHAPVRRQRRGRPGRGGLRGRRLDPAAAAGPAGLAGGRPGRGAVLGSRRRLGQRRGRVAPPVLDRAAGDRRHRPGAAGLEQLRPRRGRVDGALRRLHAPVPPQRLRHLDQRRRRRRLADQLRGPAALLRATSRRNCRSRASTGRGATRTATRTGRIRSAATARSSCAARTRPASRPRSARSPSPTAGSATARTASTAGSACRAARSTPRHPR